MFSSYQLRALDAVATHGSVARAARVLHMTPSGVSQQLAKLERDAGRALLEPHGRSVRLTRAGRVLAEHARAVVDRLATAELDLADLGEEVLGPLRIGGVGSAVRELLPPALTALAENHPRVAATVVDGEAVDLVPRLLDGELDLVLAESWAERPMAVPEGVGQCVLLAENARVALPAGHRLAGHAEVDLFDLAGEVWASCPPGTAPHEALTQRMRAHGHEPDVRYALAEHVTQLSLIRRGLAVALVPVLSVRSEPEGVWFAATRPALRREIRAVWAVRSAGPAVRACVALLRAAAAEEVDGSAVPGAVAAAGEPPAPGKGGEEAEALPAVPAAAPRAVPGRAPAGSEGDQ